MGRAWTFGCAPFRCRDAAAPDARRALARLSHRPHPLSVDTSRALPLRL